MPTPAAENRLLSLDDAKAVLDGLALAERLKRELRHSWLSDGRRESVAEHTWMMAVAAVLVAPRLEQPVDLGRTLALIAIHDLAEAVTGDIPWFEESPRQNAKLEAEARAMDEIGAMLPADIAASLKDMWREYEDGLTAEAKFARALDKLEVQNQHNLADFGTWEPVEYDLVYTKMTRECAHDSSLRTLLAAIRGRAETKMREAGVDPDPIRERAG